MRVEVRSNFRSADRRARRGAVLGLTMAAEHILTASRAVVPLEEGTLERSGRADVDEGSLRAAVSYGGTDETTRIVAVVQHERLDYQHAPGRTAKYLEGPMNEESGTVGEILAAQIRRALR